MWHENGKLKLICTYVNYKREGDSKEWSEEGVLIAHVIYEKGIEVRRIV